MSIRHTCLLGFLMSALAFGSFSPAKARFQDVEIADFTGDGNGNDFGTPGSKLLVEGESDDRNILGTLAVMKQESSKYLITKDSVRVGTTSLNAGRIDSFTFITLNAIDNVAISSGASVAVLTPSGGSAAGRWLIVDGSAGGGDDYLLQETGPGTSRVYLYYPNWAIIYTGSLADGKHELSGHEGTKISRDEVCANFDGDVNVSFRLPFDIFASLSSPTPFVSALRFLGTNDGEDMGAIRFGVQLPVFEEVEMDIESIITNDSTIYIDIYLEDANGDEIENIVILPDFSNIDSAFHPPAYIADDFAPTTSTYSNLWDGSMYGLDDLVDDVLGAINYGSLIIEDRGNGRYSVSYRIAKDNIATTGKKLISIRAVAFPGNLPWNTMADIYAAFKYYPVTGTRPIILAEWTTLPLPLPDVDPELEISHLLLNNKFAPRVPAKLILVSGNNQTGEPKTPLPNPFVVQVTDEEGEPFEGVPVTFEITQGGGQALLIPIEGEETYEKEEIYTFVYQDLNGNGQWDPGEPWKITIPDTAPGEGEFTEKTEFPLTILTDAQGLAKFTLILGDPGLIRVRATAPNIAEPVFFEAIAKLRADFNDIPDRSVDVGDTISGLKTHGWGQIGEINVVDLGEIGNAVEMIPAARDSGLGMQFPSTGKGGIDLSDTAVQFFMSADDVACGVSLSDSFVENDVDPFRGRSFVRFIFEPGRESFSVEASPDIEFNGQARPVPIQQRVWYHYEIRFVTDLSRGKLLCLVLVNGRSVIEGQLPLGDMDTQSIYMDFYAHLNSNSNSRVYFKNISYDEACGSNGTDGESSGQDLPEALGIIVNDGATDTDSAIVKKLELKAEDHQGGTGIMNAYIDGEGVDQPITIIWGVDSPIEFEPDLSIYPPLVLEHRSSGTKRIRMVVENQDGKLSMYRCFPITSEDVLRGITPLCEIYLNIVTHTFTVKLVDGLNIIGVPLDPGISGQPWTLGDLRNHIINLIGPGSVGEITYSTPQGRPRYFTPFEDPDISFGAGYIVDMNLNSGEEIEVSFSGTPWANNVIALVEGTNIISVPLDPGISGQPWTLGDLENYIEGIRPDSVDIITYSTPQGRLRNFTPFEDPEVSCGVGYIVEMNLDVEVRFLGHPCVDQ